MSSQGDWTAESEAARVDATAVWELDRIVKQLEAFPEAASAAVRTIDTARTQLASATSTGEQLLVQTLQCPPQIIGLKMAANCSPAFATKAWETRIDAAMHGATASVCALSNCLDACQ